MVSLVIDKWEVNLDRTWKIMRKFASCACFALNWRSRKTENIPWRIQRQNSIWSFSKLFSYYRIVIVSMIMIIVVTTLIIMITISQWAFEALMWATKLEMEYDNLKNIIIIINVIIIIIITIMNPDYLYHRICFVGIW